MKSIVRWFRTRRSVKKWNADIPLISAMSERHKDGPFYWGQLVWQEVSMYILLAKQVEPEEFSALCERRGFDSMMRAYLSGMLRHVLLGCKLSPNVAIERLP